MLVKYRLPVEMDGKAAAGVQFSWRDICYKFNVENGNVSELEITARNFPLESMPTFTASQSLGAHPTLNVPPDPVWPQIERMLMFMEGAMALLGLRNLGFERKTTEWVPESEQERSKNFVYSFSMGRARQKPNLPIPFDMFARSMIVADELASFEVALNFNRRGRMSLGEGRYIEAVYEFYFVLETLFADGAFKTKQVVAKFMGSASLMAAVEAAQRALASDARFARLPYPNKTKIYLHASVSDVVEQIVAARGFLHHHSGKQRDSWHPRRQDEHHADAIFLAQVCFEVLGAVLFGAMYSQTSTQEFLGIRFTNEDGAKIDFVDMVPPSD